MIPSATLRHAAIKTAAAPLSLPCFTNGWGSGLTRSKKLSSVVLKHSAIQTSEMATKMRHHSIALSFNHILSPTTMIVANKWKRALFCVFTTWTRPSKAYWIDLNIDLILIMEFFIT